jgi:hypothetical protein
LEKVMLRSIVGIARIFALGGADLVAFFASCLLGYLAGSYLPAGQWSGFAGVAVAYHLFVAWLLIVADEEMHFSMGVFSSLLTHVACMAVVCGSSFAAVSASQQGAASSLPGLGLLRFSVIFLAIFERNWLFGAKTRFFKTEEPAAPASNVFLSGEDYEEFLQHLASRDPLTLKPGTSVTAEYHQWRNARASGQGLAARSGQ